MFKKIFTIIFLSMIVISFVVTPVNAVAPTSYESSIQVRNLTDSGGEISLTFYDLTGAVVGTPFDDTIAANETKSYYQSSMPVTEGFIGSVVISSSVQVAAMSNIVGLDVSSSPISYAAYGGFSSGSGNVYLPTLFKDNYGYNTFFYVQNTGSANTDVTITYSDGGSNSITGLQPGQSEVVRQADETHAEMVFSGILEATSSEIAVTVVEEGNTLFSYDGFGEGGTSLIMPLINQNNYGYFTGVQIQNTGATDTVVTVSYSPSISGTACTETRTVPAGGSKTFSQFVFYQSQTETDPAFATTCTMGETFIGSAKVTGNTESMSLVSVVNQLQIADNKGGAYGAFNAADGQEKLIYPLIMDRNYGYFTSWSIVNVGAATIAVGDLSCHVTGTSAGGAVDMYFDNTEAIPVDGSWTLNHQNLIADGFVGGATCVGPAGSKLIGTTNQLGIGSMWTGKDTLLVSEGFTVAP